MKTVVSKTVFGLNLLSPVFALAQNAAAPAAGAQQELGPAAMISTFLPMILLFVVFYFALIRPQKKKEKKAKEMLAALKVGDRVSTIGGIYGTIVNIKDDIMPLSVGQDNVKLVFARWAIRQVEDVSVENDAEALN